MQKLSQVFQKPKKNDAGSRTKKFDLASLFRSPMRARAAK